VCFIRRATKFPKNFFDGTLGGSRKALAAAIAWRNRTIAKLEVVTLRQFCAIKRSNNTSGVPGVHFLKTRAQPMALGGRE
jgi:hypothetical protein